MKVQDTTINQRFEYLHSLASMVINEVTPSLVVTGEGGLGKTHTIKQAIEDNGLLERDYIFFKGYSSARGLYNSLYDNNDKLIIFDDCDSILEDKVALNILKGALDSYDTRTVTWMTKMNKGDEYPQQFNFTGRIIFISNKDKNSIDGAVLSRSLVVDVTMTPAEKIERMAHILPHIMPEYSLDSKIDALQFLEKNQDVRNLNLRTLIMITKIRNTQPHQWKSVAGYMLKS